MANEETMQEDKKTILTYQGLRKYEQELQDLKVNRRQEVAEKLKEARAQGDLSENGEYDAAKDEQRDIEARIVELETMLKNVEVVVDDDVDASKINIGCTVKLHDEEFDEEIIYTIVGSSEADPMNNRISNESPVGAALIGAKPGDRVEFETPGGMMTLLVKEINL